MTSDAIRNKIRQELQAAQTIARRAVDEQRGMTADDKAQLQRHKDTAALLERQLPGAESENLIAEIGRFSGAPEHQRQAPRGSDTRIPDGRGGEVIALSKAHRCVDFLRARGLMGHDEDIRAERVLPALLVPEARRFCNDVEQRALAATTVTGGGVLLASPIAATIIDLARAKSAIFSAGAVILPMTSGTLTVPKITGGAEPEWVDENQEPSESDIVFGDITLTTKNLACVVRVSEELVQDAPDQAGVVVTRELTAAMAATFDTACLTGTGLTNQPKGLQYWGINTVSMGANGGTPTDYSKLLDAIAAVRAQHGEPTAFIWNSRTARTFDGLVSSVDSQPLIPPPALANNPRLISNQLPNNEVQGSSSDASSIYTGVWEELVVGLRLALAIEVSQHAGGAFEKRQRLVRAWIRGDVAPQRAAHFCRVLGVRA